VGGGRGKAEFIGGLHRIEGGEEEEGGKRNAGRGRCLGKEG